MAYDSAIVSFTTKTDKVDLVSAAHINDLQTEIVRIETILGALVKGTATDLKTRLSRSLDSDGTLQSGSSFPSPAFISMPFWRTDLDTFYIYGSSGWIQQGGSVGNALFQYSGVVDQAASNKGEIQGTSLIPNAGTKTGSFRFLCTDNSSFEQVWNTRWTKISGVSTITVHALLWTRNGSGGADQSDLQVSVGGQTGHVACTSDSQTPTWYSFTINVSGLTNGTTYDVLASLKAINDSISYCGGIIAFGS